MRYKKEKNIWNSHVHEISIVKGKDGKYLKFNFYQWITEADIKKLPIEKQLKVYKDALDFALFLTTKDRDELDHKKLLLRLLHYSFFNVIGDY